MFKRRDGSCLRQAVCDSAANRTSRATNQRSQVCNKSAIALQPVIERLPSSASTRSTIVVYLKEWKRYSAKRLHSPTRSTVVRRSIHSSSSHSQSPWCSGPVRISKWSMITGSFGYHGLRQQLLGTRHCLRLALLYETSLCSLTPGHRRRIRPGACDEVRRPRSNSFVRPHLSHRSCPEPQHRLAPSETRNGGRCWLDRLRSPLVSAYEFRYAARPRVKPARDGFEPCAKQLPLEKRSCSRCNRSRSSRDFICFLRLTFTDS